MGYDSEEVLTSRVRGQFVQANVRFAVLLLLASWFCILYREFRIVFTEMFC